MWTLTGPVELAHKVTISNPWLGSSLSCMIKANGEIIVWLLISLLLVGTQRGEVVRNRLQKAEWDPMLENLSDHT